MAAAPPDSAIAEVLAQIAFDRDGLVTAVAQQHDTGEVLMVAWMNRAAVEATLSERRGVYWSRSRMKLWRKGEESGQTQALIEILVDCDGDTLLLKVDQTGVACHTGRRNCFFRALRGGKLETIAEIVVDPAVLYPRTD